MQLYVIDDCWAAKMQRSRAAKSRVTRSSLNVSSHLLASWPNPVVENIIAGRDLACIQFHGVGGISKNGADFNMQYCWNVKVRDEKIVEITTY